MYVEIFDATVLTTPSPKNRILLAVDLVGVTLGVFVGVVVTVGVFVGVLVTVGVGVLVTVGVTVGVVVAVGVFVGVTDAVGVGVGGGTYEFQKPLAVNQSLASVAVKKVCGFPYSFETISAKSINSLSPNPSVL